MGARAENFQLDTSGGPLAIVFYIFLIALVIYSLFKTYQYLQERQKWSWFFSLCKTKRLSPKEVTYLKQIVIRKKITNTEDLYGSMYSLQLPTPIKKKLLFDNEPGGR